MPTYSYRCTECERVFDAFHSMTCTDKQYCPNCGKEGKKLMSASSVIFKGSGFYSTDYRDSGYLEAKKQDGTQAAGEVKSESGEKAAPATSPKNGSEGAKTEAPKVESKTESKSNKEAAA
jgi:putative FmdB family regulatory protein